MADGPSFSELENGEEIGMYGGLTATDLHDVGLSFVAHDSVEHFFDERERAMLEPLRAARGVTHGATQVAGVGDLDEREAGMLLVIGAQAAVVRAAPLHRSVVDHGHFGAFDEDFAATPVIIDIVGNQHAFGAVLGAALQQEDFAVLENDLAFQFVEARGTNGDGHVVERVGPNALSQEAPLWPARNTK